MNTKKLIRNGAFMICAIFSAHAFAQNDVPEGALKGLFSVGNGRQVYFSKGNLQYQASTKTWRFAEKQTDIVGLDNANISSNYTGWIDLFGWGTSGYKHGAVCYQPWSTSKNDNDYCAYGQITNDLSGKADWGYNPISNGGNTESQWRTLSGAEWEYLLIKRNTPSGIKYVYGRIDGVPGLIILPDDWDIKYCDLSNPNGYGPTRTLMNKFSEEEWKALLEAHGAAFLPITGMRKGTQITDVNRIGQLFAVVGNYWSTSRGNSSHWSTDPNDIKYLSFTDEGGTTIASFAGHRFYGFGVRLVRNAQ